MLYRFFSGDFPITIALYLIFGLWAAGRRSVLRSVATEDTPVWNWIGRITLGALAAFPTWVAVADNWRQMLGYVFSRGDRWQSDPFETSVTAEPVRIVSLVLLGTVIFGIAMLYSRRHGSIPMAVLWVAVAVPYFYFLNPIRIRIDVLMLQTQTSLSHPHVVDVAFIVFWASGLYLLVASLIIAAMVVLWGAALVPVRLLYWLLTRGRPDSEEPVFSLYRLRAQALHGSAGRGGKRHGNGQTNG